LDLQYSVGFSIEKDWWYLWLSCLIAISVTVVLVVIMSCNLNMMSAILGELEGLLTVRLEFICERFNLDFIFVYTLCLRVLDLESMSISIMYFIVSMRNMIISYQWF
jgi:hypothetical protein